MISTVGLRRTQPNVCLMRWIAPAEKDVASATLEKGLWDPADQFRANSGQFALDELEAT